eukprot:CAMPEP_0179492162 /NCGR_PEP_ID=MMETSP0799-20121207/66595_1 /TAXON_ID=46947 /ORGANISM="Geminigera cryophila, Strain CCMP2564" /LENGTH=148 /DNA_ID=CAMNT_0021308903 /DNA_START=19 /DNA_END=463 /DNA_ORIENTATION=-
MSAQPDLYRLLNVSRDATAEELKRAYKKEAMKWHPDRQAMKSEEEKTKAEERFKLVSEANVVLQDKFKKVVYDKYGHDGLEKELTRERNGSKSQDLASHPTDPFENYTTDARTQAAFEKTALEAHYRAQQAHYKAQQQAGMKGNNETQ